MNSPAAEAMIDRMLTATSRDDSIAAVQAMSQVGQAAEGGEPAVNPFAGAMWPWNLMQGQEGDDAGGAEAPAKKSAPRSKTSDK